jgi:hypothetical protein
MSKQMMMSNAQQLKSMSLTFGMKTTIQKSLMERHLNLDNCNPLTAENKYIVWLGY